MRRYFSLYEQETYKPPANVAKQAKKALEYKDKYPNDVKDSGTKVGWTRANQLANRENLSLDTVKRMYSFFSRHKGNEKVNPEYKDEPWKDNGYLMHLAWGGDAGFTWSKSIVEKLEERHMQSWKGWFSPFTDKMFQFNTNMLHSEMASSLLKAQDEEDAVDSGYIRVYVYDNNVNIQSKNVPDERIFNVVKDKIEQNSLQSKIKMTVWETDKRVFTFKKQSFFYADTIKDATSIK